MGKLDWTAALAQDAQVDPIYITSSLRMPRLAHHFPAQEATKLAHYLHLIHIFVRASSHMNGTSQIAQIKNESSLTQIIVHVQLKFTSVHGLGSGLNDALHRYGYFKSMYSLI